MSKKLIALIFISIALIFTACANSNASQAPASETPEVTETLPSPAPTPTPEPTPKAEVILSANEVIDRIAELEDTGIIVKFEGYVSSRDQYFLYIVNSENEVSGDASLDDTLDRAYKTVLLSNVSNEEEFKPGDHLLIQGSLINSSKKFEVGSGFYRTVKFAYLESPSVQILLDS